MLLALSLYSGHAACDAHESTNTSIHVISTTAESFADEVFLGEDRQMPDDGSKKIAISPTRVEAGFFVPKTFGEAFAEIDGMLPKWFKVALKASRDEQECSVLINDVSYDVNIYSWIELNWGLKSASSSATKMFREFGITRVDTMTEALQTGYCAFVKTNEAAGVEAMKPYAMALAK